ncbi:MAG TPA: hypothetical protein VJK48_00220, partial [Chlamydiales bacterium]|nr:hypothetical protein [Chlamydiales bacterium]
PNHPRSELAERKYEKQEMKKERLKHIPIHPSEDEKNHLMKHRTPIFDRTNDALPKHAKPSKKKKPPL